MKNKKWINGRNFVVSGASSGIGRLLTEKLIDCGCTVTGIGRSEKKFDDFKLSLGEKSANLNVEIFDVTEEREWEALAKRLEEKYGKIESHWCGQLDLLAANYELFIMAKNKVQEDGMMIPNRFGSLDKHPLLAQIKDSNIQCVKLINEFGLSPKSNSKIKAESSDDAEYLDSLMNG